MRYFVFREALLLILLATSFLYVGTTSANTETGDSQTEDLETLQQSDDSNLHSNANV